MPADVLLPAAMPASHYNLRKLRFDRTPAKKPAFAVRNPLDAALAKLPSTQFSLTPRLLPAGGYSYPYHSHRYAEELFVILEGAATLRTPDGLRKVRAGDVLFFPKGPDGAHQLHNHTRKPCVYLDLSVTPEVDICDYPDSGKLQILRHGEIFKKASAVPYFEGEETPAAHWPKASRRRGPRPSPR